MVCGVLISGAFFVMAGRGSGGDTGRMPGQA
jgi:DHA1 family bicyclomycin/chloramphenicol resistance-like MFS transporter